MAKETKNWVYYSLMITGLIVSIVFFGFSIAFIVYTDRARLFALNTPSVQPPISESTALFLEVISFIMAFACFGLIIWLIIALYNQKKESKLSMAQKIESRKKGLSGINSDQVKKSKYTDKDINALIDFKCSEIQDPGLKSDCESMIRLRKATDENSKNLYLNYVNSTANKLPKDKGDVFKSLAVSTINPEARRAGREYGAREVVGGALSIKRDGK